MKKNRQQRKQELNKLKHDNERLSKQAQFFNERNYLLSMTCRNEKERADKFEKKYFDKLKQQFEYNHKDITTLSLMVNKQVPYDETYARSRIPQEQIDEYYKRNIVQTLAESLYNNFECLRKTESHIGTRIDLMLLKWNDEQARQEYEEMKMYMEP